MDWLETEIHRKYHEVASLFPLLEGEEFEVLKADIAENGLIEPIWLHQDGTIIDGRNRHRACIEAEVRPRFETWNNGKSLVAFVVSKNLHRRHLTSSQKAAIALDVLPMLENEAKERMRAGGEVTTKQGTQKIAYPDNEIGEAREQAARLFNTNRQYVSDAKKLREEAPDLLETVRAGELTIPRAKEELARRSGKMAVHYSSGTAEWYTPQVIISRVIDAMGGIDLDPCSNSHTEPNVPAATHFTTENDGLQQQWNGRVYMNPPYGREIEDWVNYLCEQYEGGNVKEAIALVPSRTDTAWFRRLRQYPRCFIWGRLRFSEQAAGAPFPSMAVYLGKNVRGFVDAFSDIGDTYALV